MLDFLMVSVRHPKKDVTEIYPKFTLQNEPTDIMVQGSGSKRSFYAIWNEETKLWSKKESVAIKLIDKELKRYAQEHEKDFGEDKVKIAYLWDTDSGSIDKFHKFVEKQMWENYKPLDCNVIFDNTETTKESYATFKLPYSLGYDPTPAYTELSTSLYSPEELMKWEWAIGSVIAGDAKINQKFVVLYGPPGSGKSTMIGIAEKLFKSGSSGYCKSFNAKELGGSSDFALQSLADNPLVAIQHDGDLSKIEDNTRLNTIVSHETTVANVKYRSAFEVKFNSFLIMGTNKPVKITDAMSGIIRRLIDISPSGKKIENSRYNVLKQQINTELGGIAGHCLQVYESNKHMYDNYIPTTMLGASNDFYNYVLDHYDIFKEQDGTTLKSAWEQYKNYCEDAKVPYPLTLRVFKEELKNYFRNFSERAVLEDEVRARNYYSGFIFDKFMGDVVDPDLYKEKDALKLTHKKSLLDDILKDCPAQYGNEKEKPSYKWDNVVTTLKDLNTSELHYVRPPDNHIVIDFDIKDENGNKSFKLNAEAAAKWPPTYAELSKGGQGIHLHYIYTGDVSKLSCVYDDNVEIKVFTGNSSLRRKLSKCNDIPVATISSGLPLRKEKKVIDKDIVKNEKGIRTLIKRNLNKEIHPGTKPSVDFIFKILEDAYSDGIQYDVTDMRASILKFAAGSSHQADYCIKLVNKMHFKSEADPEPIASADILPVFFDVEVFPNLFIVVWKALDKGSVKMINPTPTQVEELLKFNLVGFNNRKYDNHILYGRLMGYSNQQLFMLSQKIINGDRDAFFGEAYNLSYTDIYDFSSVKQSLKKFEIELGIHHQENAIPWDEPVDESLWDQVANYCVNDVLATEAVWKARADDFAVRQALAALSGLTVNDTTRMHTTKIIFGNEKHPNLVYTDLSEMFPGYSFENGKSNYMDEDPGEGGYVYAEPGMYSNVALLDIASMHPSSIIALNLFGDYTANFKALLDARLYIKHRDFDRAGSLLNGALKPFLKDVDQADSLAKALKLALNSVYGYTTATFDNPFKDIRNKDNIVAKRGSLFMINLKREVQKRGYTVAHIKTDSIKIPNADQDIIDFVMHYGKQYGYNFEHEATYDRMCLVNDAVYIAKYNEQGIINKGGKHANEWTATGTQFQVPYVFKTLFSKEPLEFSDFCETKTVKSALYLDFNENLPEGEHKYRFVGKAGQFTPVVPGAGGGELLREQGGKYYSATGAKGYRWMESEVLRTISDVALDKLEDIDVSYYNHLCDEAKAAISSYGDFEQFVRE